MELVCPAGNLPSLKTAIDNGADVVYIGFRDATNARHFPGLNFTPEAAGEAVAYAHGRGRKVFVALNTYPQTGGWKSWTDAVDRAAELGVDALILADIGLMDYAAGKWPELALHLSVQGSATSAEALNFYHEQFRIRRAVLPRVLSLNQIRQVIKDSPVEIEVFGFGSLCVMVEGRCQLSSYVTGRSPNTYGACSPAESVRWQETGEGLEARLNDVLIDRFADGEPAGYPVVCKGRFSVNEHTYYAIEEPVSLNTLGILPQLQAAGVAAVKIEGRQRSPAYVGQVASIWREALDACRREGENYRPRQEWLQGLETLSEGAQTTLGAMHRPWQ